MSQALATLALVALNIMDMETRVAALCESENTKVKVWLAPLEPLGETEMAEGCGGGTTTVQAPRATHPVLAPASDAYKYVVLAPVNPGRKVSERFRVKVLPARLTELPAPVTTHSLFCWLPPP